MSVYAVGGHPLLSGKANQLSPQELQGQVLLAESLLGVPATAHTDQRLRERAELAVVLQVNFQLESGTDPLIVRRIHSSHTTQTTEYWGKYIDPRAMEVWLSTTSLEDRSGRFGSGVQSLRRGPGARHYNRHGGYL